MDKQFLGVFLVLGVLVFGSVLVFAAPNGAESVTQVTSTTALADSPDTNLALEGNITEVDVNGYSTTQTWQGYFGNVTGTVQLADSSDNVMYNWSLANPEGEIYASTASSITWSSVACFNFTLNGAALEALFNIDSGDVDGVDETFAVKNHDLFYTNNIEFAADSCDSVQLYDSTGASTDGSFEEVLLTDGTNTIFASLLEEASINGFDNRDHDFQMLVLEDGHGTDTSTTTYYFYVELE